MEDSWLGCLGAMNLENQNPMPSSCCSHPFTICVLVCRIWKTELISCETHRNELKNKTTGMTEYYHLCLCQWQVLPLPRANPKDFWKCLAQDVWMPYRKLLPWFLQPNKCFSCSSKEIFSKHHEVCIFHFIGSAYKRHELFSTYLRKSSPLNQLAKGKQAMPSQIWEHMEWVGSSRSRGCVGA